VTTVHSAFEQTARAHRARPFLLVLPEKLQLTYGEALDRVAGIAARYRAGGYGPGHRVALKLPNCPDYLLHFLALNSIGASVLPLNPEYRAAELEYVLGHSEASAVITLENLKDPPFRETQVTPASAPCSIPRAPRESRKAACSAISIFSTSENATSTKAACARCGRGKSA